MAWDVISDSGKGKRVRGSGIFGDASLYSKDARWTLVRADIKHNPAFRRFPT